ncbi:MAG: M14 family zinc carboxypeptidase [Gemmatimonadales bacterium]
MKVARFAMVIALTLAAAPTAAQVPTFAEVTGHAFGARITVHQEMAAYLWALAERSDRVTVVHQGRSWEERDLLVAIITHPDNHARLDAIRQTSLRLADPRGLTVAEADRLLATQPAVVWFGGSIHGFELSGSEGALKLLEHLTTRNDGATMEVLRNTVILIDPMLNPDGRDAFANRNHMSIGRVPSADPDDWSNNYDGWDGVTYRTGHYYFDNNRDWFAQTQPETRHRQAFLFTWAPQVAVDMHEMGVNAEFFFDPPADPINPYAPPFMYRWLGLFGRAYAQAFDSAGFEYMARERYNYFYAGYTSNRGYQGAVAMLFEQGSTRGLAMDRGDGSIRTLAQALEQQYVAAVTTARLSATRRADLLREYLASQREAVAGGHGGVQRYVIAANEGDPGLVRDLVTLLRRNGATVGRLAQDVRLAGVRDRAGAPVGQRAFRAGDYVVELAQPAGRMVGTLLAPDTPIPEAFLRQARAAVERAENPRFYDITSWSLGLLFNLGVYGSTDARALATTEDREGAEGAGDVRQASYAYVLDGRNTRTPAAMMQLLAAGHRVATLQQPSRFDGQIMPGGAGIVRVGQNDESVHEAVRAAAERYGIQVTSMQGGLPDSGFPSLGSGDWTFNLRRPVIGLFAQDGIQGYSFGWNWYTIDRQYELSHVVLRPRSLANTRLERFTTLVIPEVQAGAFREALGEAGLARLRRWVQDGGTLIAIGAAGEWARTTFELALRNWYDTDEGKDQQAFTVPGATMQAQLDTLHWITAGYQGATLPVHVNSSRLWLPPEGPPNSGRRVIATYAASPRLSGHAWNESLERLPGKVYAYEQRVGQGRVIVFAEEVSFRAYGRGTNRLLLNGMVLGPTAP